MESVQEDNMKVDNDNHQQRQRSGDNLQLIYGIALLLAGLGVFYRIPQVMPQISAIKQFASAVWFIRFCFYFMGIILIGGGVKKILGHFKES
jgi:uncharacterized membrane protein